MINTQQSNEIQKFEFQKLEESQKMIVNDGVMGGLSSSQFKNHQDVMIFNGRVSLENNGGFASIRMIWPFESVEGINKIQIKVKGDGKAYQFRLRTNRGFGGASYVHEFKTIKNQWQDITVDIDSFTPQFRGRILTNMPQLKLIDVQQMGFLIASKKPGKFNLELKSISLISD